MLREEHLDAAVAEGIVTQAQATALRDFAAKRERVRARALGHEERFRFMRGFNDFFFATGVVMLGAGLMFFAGAGVTGNLVTAAVLWALAELLVGRMRLVLPGILLVCFFVEAIYRAIPVDLWSTAASAPLQRMPASWIDLFLGGGMISRAAAPATIALKALLGSGGAALFYARFRLPFALLLVAGGLVVASAALAREIGGTGAAQSLVLLFCGLAVFAAAMGFDASDRERLTRRADCAFWLHLLAAPLIVHSLITLTVSDLNFLSLTTGAALTIVAIAVALALVAVLIDRRALLVSTLSYLGFVIAYAIRNAGASAPTDQAAVFFATLALLGVLVLGLGVGWQPLRRALLTLLPTPAIDRLPPAAPATS
ncbi:MAG TPA: hypothetical protein VIY51_22645 [Xanthobacteraceae bacterium]